MPGLREQKKLATRQEIAALARSLAMERGLDGFTIAELTQRVGVSNRTFFNYFPNKESAVVAAELETVRDAGRSLVDQPDGMPPLEALRNALLAPEALASATPSWKERLELVRRHPVLAPLNLAAMEDVQTELVSRMAERLGVDVTSDPRPTIAVSAAVGVIRSVTTWWFRHGEPGELRDHLEEAFDLLANGISWQPNLEGDEDQPPSSRTEVAG